MPYAEVAEYYQAQCECGWNGRETCDWREAESEAEEHTADHTDGSTT